MPSPKVGLWEWYLQSDQVKWSPEVLELFGVSEAEFGGTFEEVEARVHPDDRERWREDVNRCLAGEKPHQIELRVVLPEGGIRWLEIYGNADRDGSGQPTRLLGVAVDLTEHQRIRTALQVQAERFQSLMEHTAEGFYMFDIDPPVPIHTNVREQVDRFYDCRIVEANDALARMYGFESGHHLLGTTLEALHGSRDDPTNLEFLCAFVENGYRITDALSCETDSQGNPVWFSNNVVGIVENGHLVRVWGSQTDVTARERLREQVEQSSRLESMGRLAGGVAHDLNNLLAPILGFGELLQLEVEGDERREHADIIVQAALRARDLVAQLLAFGRRQPLQVAAVDLNEVIREFEPLLRRTVREDVELDLELDPRLASIRADPSQMGQVLVNVVVNGTQAMPNGGKLRIRTGTTTLKGTDPDGLPPGSYATLQIQDTGLGMDPETLSRAFEPFFTTKGERGTGLGLATVYGIVKQHGGDVAVESAPGQGSSFTFYFPETASSEETTASPSPRAPRRQGRERILVVEDDDQTRQVVVAMLKRQGHDVQEAADGLAALQLLGRRPEVDLIISDVIMPRMSGRELGKAVAAAHPSVRVIYMSGYSEELVWQCSMGTLLRKPFSSEELIRAVRETLQRTPA